MKTTYELTTYCTTVNIIRHRRSHVYRNFRCLISILKFTWVVDTINHTSTQYAIGLSPTNQKITAKNSHRIYSVHSSASAKNDKTKLPVKSGHRTTSHFTPTGRTKIWLTSPHLQHAQHGYSWRKTDLYLRPAECHLLFWI